ncbi:transposase [Alienimonas californiensis]|uniref:Uncharacterized protein n=1 Tax=Alienimonas californiensis TaxID=2527989 RepID=A0A517P9M0_9PLAN|nr:transposase [Alienimonas californiensis]QDT16068.1 hypothetical protein CA12_21660 [Alienimonas californiensis]
MPAAFRCPHCRKAYLIEKAQENRVFKCRKCCGMIEFEGRPETDLDIPKVETPKKWTDRFKLKEMPGWAAGLLTAGIVGVLALLATLGMGPLGDPHDRLYSALSDEYAALTALVDDLDSPEAAAAAEPEMQAHVQEVLRLMDDPRPFGRGRKAVGAAFLREYDGAIKARLESLREAKGRAFDRQGVGSVVSRVLRPIPQSELDFRRAFEA